MKTQKDLFDLFRENQQKLDESPNPQVWRRLEKRLDTRRTSHGSSIYRIMAMAAAILLLIGVFSLLPALDQSAGQDEAVALNTPPSEMEDLAQDAPADQNIIKVVEFSRQYQDRMVQPIEEGNSHKRLVPSTKLQPGQPMDSRGDTTLSQGGEG
ncbi:MAG: hypothetical protein R2824_17540 [Saprospiraceae bacterium]|nr:hypothetical protein [Lewinella sp.]